MNLASMLKTLEKKIDESNEKDDEKLTGAQKLSLILVLIVLLGIFAHDHNIRYKKAYEYAKEVACEQVLYYPSTAEFEKFKKSNVTFEYADDIYDYYIVELPTTAQNLLGVYVSQTIEFEIGLRKDRNYTVLGFILDNSLGDDYYYYCLSEY